MFSKIANRLSSRKRPAPIPVLEPVNNKAQGKVLHTTVSFPSGRMLVAEQFVFKGLQKRMDALLDEHLCDLRQSWGRARHTTLMATRLNLIDMLVTDACPQLLREPGSDRIFAGEADSRFQCPYQPDRLLYDRHGLSIIDRQVAIDMMIEGGWTHARAEQDLEWSMFEIAVEPGEWHLYFQADWTAMSPALADAGIAAPGGSEFVLSKEPLALNPDRLIDLTEEFRLDVDPPSPMRP